jgi:hypothetical protein
MSVEMVARTIQYILAPVVMISACAILQTGLLGHYTDISSRLRALSRERFELVMGGHRGEKTLADGTFYDTERLVEIDHQAPDLLHRHRLVRDCALAIYAAIFFFVVDMGLIGAAVVSNTNGIATLALVAFLIGLAALLWGILHIVVEIRSSHRAVEYEVGRVLSLPQSIKDENSGEQIQADKVRHLYMKTNQKPNSKKET